MTLTVELLRRVQLASVLVQLRAGRLYVLLQLRNARLRMLVVLRHRAVSCVRVAHTLPQLSIERFQIAHHVLALRRLVARMRQLTVEIAQLRTVLLGLASRTRTRLVALQLGAG